MYFSILIIFFSLILIIVAHEFGHFLLAKAFGVKVEEFGVFYPPRLIGKKFGQTLYSLNLLPLGAFVKIAEKGRGSFISQSISKRILIVLGGAISFWIISFFIFSFLFSTGMPTVIEDKEKAQNPKIQIVQVFKDSPAKKAKLKVGDEILEIEGEKVDKTQEFIEKTKENLGKEIILKIKRGNKIFNVKLVPRVKPPENQGPIGISILRVGIKKYPILKSLFYALESVFKLTFKILFGYFSAFKKILLKKETGISIAGPIGASFFLWQAFQKGFPYFLNTLALLSIYLAIFNLLPIPALDGGKILFLFIEAIRKKPISKKVEERITLFFFSLLILLLIFATIEDIKRIF